MKKWLVALTAAFVFAGAGVANAFWGQWEYNGDGQEYVVLGDSSTGYGRALGGTSRYCGSPGASYANMRQVLDNNGHNGQEIYWWVDQTCNDGYVRVCVQNSSNQWACSTYADYGWIRY